MVLQLCIDVLIVYLEPKWWHCENETCKWTAWMLLSIFIYRSIFTCLTDGLLIFAIWKIHKFIKLQANIETRRTQFRFAISIVCAAFLSSLMSYIDIVLIQIYHKNDAYTKHLYLYKFDKWSEGLGHLTQFSVQITILGFCWVYATRPRPQVGKI
jgi:hypothetical protein